MDTIEQLLKLMPEEVYGANEAARDAGVEYQRDLAFAGWQLRAKPFMAEVWAEYRQVSHVERALREVFNRHDELLSLDARIAFLAELREMSGRASSLFGVWCALGCLSRAEGREDITPQQEADAIAAVAQLEEMRAEKLMQEQGARRREQAERAEAQVIEGA